MLHMNHGVRKSKEYTGHLLKDKISEILFLKEERKYN